MEEVIIKLQNVKNLKHMVQKKVQLRVNREKKILLEGIWLYSSWKIIAQDQPKQIKAEMWDTQDEVSSIKRHE